MTFITPFYYKNKFKLKDIQDWSEIVGLTQFAEKDSITAYHWYLDYTDDNKYYYDYFYKDEEKAAYWQNKYNELKAQGK